MKHRPLILLSFLIFSACTDENPRPIPPNLLGSPAPSRDTLSPPAPSIDGLWVANNTVCVDVDGGPLSLALHTLTISQANNDNLTITNTRTGTTHFTSFTGTDEFFSFDIVRTTDNMEPCDDITVCMVALDGLECTIDRVCEQREDDLFCAEVAYLRE